MDRIISSLLLGNSSLLLGNVWLIIGEWMFCLKIRRRKLFPLRALTVPLLMAFPVVVPGGMRCPVFMIGEWFTWIYLFMFALSMAITAFCFVVSVKKVIAFALATYSAQNFSHFLCSVFTFDIGIRPEEPWNTLLQLALTALTYAVFYVVFVRSYDKYNDVDLENNSLVIFTVANLGVVYLLSIFEMYSGQSNLYTHIYGMVACVLLLVVQFGLFRRKKLQESKEVAERLLDLSEKQRRLSEENIDLINRKCHDIKHHLSVMHARLSDDKFSEELEKAVNIYDRMINTGNKTLDIILTEKNLYCSVNGIELSYMLDGDALSFMDDTDVWSLFGNLLDNAIESVSAFEDRADRIITIKVSRKGAIVRIHTDNHCLQPLRFDGGLPVSTKKADGYHGFGMKSIRAIVEKYFGNMKITCEDGMFCLDIIFPRSAGLSVA